MQIERLIVNHKEESGDFSFDDTTMILSANNKKGKTTLIRTLAWAMGFKNQSISDKINKNKLETQLFITRSNGDKIEIKRKKDILRTTKKDDRKTFLFPAEYEEFVSFTYGINEKQFQLNSFASIIDQDNGWKFINRGKINYNSDYFILRRELAFLSLNKEDQDKVLEMEKKLNLWASKKEDIKKFLTISQKVNPYRKSIASSQSGLFAAINRIERRLKEIDTSISLLKSKKNIDKKIIEMIEQNNIFVLIDGKKIKLSKEHLEIQNYAEMWVDHKMVSLKKERKSLTKDKIIMQGQIDDRISLFDDKEEANLESLSDIYNISSAGLLLDKKIAGLKKILESFYKKSQNIFEEFRKEIDKYAQIISFDSHKLFTKEKFKGVSGSRRMIIVLAIRIAFNKLLVKHKGIHIPMIIDSPSANEFDQDSINIINELLSNIDQQKIIATLDDKRIKVSGRNKREIHLKDKAFSNDLFSIEK